MTTSEQIAAIRRRCGVDKIMRQLMVRLANRTAAPTCTKESNIGHYARAVGIETSRKAVRGVVLFLSEVDVGDFEQDPERRISHIRWNTDPIILAERVLGARALGWSPSDDEIQAFMESV